jgi:hypothetical protein
MSRSNYIEDIDEAASALWQGAVARAVRGKRGQAFLRELLAELDAMPNKRLIDIKLENAEGEHCAFGVMCAKRGIDMRDEHDADDEDDTGDMPDWLAGMFNIAPSLAAEIMFQNDEITSGPRAPLVGCSQLGSSEDQMLAIDLFCGLGGWTEGLGL